MKEKKVYYNSSSRSHDYLKDYIIIVLLVFLAILSVLSILVLVTSQSVYKYAYIDLQGQLGLSHMCRDNYCSTSEERIVYVKDFIDVRKEMIHGR